MPILHIFNGERESIFSFRGTPTVREALLEAGIPYEHPCGGRGVCGKCAVRIRGELSEPTSKEKIPGYRLSCMTRLLGDATVWLKETENMTVEGTGASTEVMFCPADDPRLSGRAEMNRNPIGVFDIGTTTVAFRMLDEDGTVLAGSGAINPQRAIAADVIGRIAEAGKGDLRQTEMIRTCMENLIGQVTDELNISGAAAIQDPQKIRYIVTGNTVMLYLLSGTDPEELGHAPFTVTRHFDETLLFPFGEAYLAPCMSAFVGADLGCAVLASGMAENNETALLCDAGTNGEVALWDGKNLWVTSVAAGPAFEGVGIRNGRMSIPGAICRVRLVNGEYFSETVDGLPAIGICGSGVLDTVACGLERRDIDETGYLAEPIRLECGISLYPEDVRSVQLAKAALAAGIRMISERAGVRVAEIGTWYLCGGFGSHLDPASAIAIGLLPPESRGKTIALGNAALTGACLLRKNGNREKLRRIVSEAKHVTLGGDPKFNEVYIEQMIFPEPEC